MNETWENTRKALEEAVRASISVQEKAYYMSTLALMRIAEQMPNPLDRPE